MMPQDPEQRAPETDPDPLDLLGTGRQNQKLSAEEKRQRDRDDNDVRKVLSLPEGRRFIWKLMGRAGVFRASFTANSNQTAFHEGQRDCGLALLQDVNRADEAAFAQMQREYLSEIASKTEKKKS